MRMSRVWIFVSLRVTSAEEKGFWACEKAWFRLQNLAFSFPSKRKGVAHPPTNPWLAIRARLDSGAFKDGDRTSSM